MGSTHRSFIPAAGSDRLLPFYDLFTRLLGADRVHKRLLDQASIRPGDRVLEIGCGTGNLAILAKRRNPSVEVLGIDPDPKALSRARRKARRAGLEVDFREGFTEELPFPDGSIDKVLSAFMLHHIDPDSRGISLREVRRVLNQSGALHLADFHDQGHVRGHHGRHASRRTEEALEQDTIARLMLGAGFSEAQRMAEAGSLLGAVAFYAAIR